jgi:hypothetical protein
MTHPVQKNRIIITTLSPSTEVAHCVHISDPGSILECAKCKVVWIFFYSSTMTWGSKYRRLEI